MGYQKQNGRFWDANPAKAFTCQGSVTPDYCILQTQSAAEAECNRNQVCQGYVYRPSDTSNWQVTNNPTPDVGPSDGVFMKKVAGGSSGGGGGGIDPIWIIVIGGCVVGGIILLLLLVKRK